MVFKINIGEKGRTYKIEVNNENLIGIKIGDKIVGSEIKSELTGYDLEVTGTSDIAGFPGDKNIEGVNMKRVLLKKGKFMKVSRPHGLRLKKTLRGNTISKDTIQINTKVVKSGEKKLEEIFPEQNKPKEEIKPREEVKTN